jgi:hypothetical protein
MVSMRFMNYCMSFLTSCTGVPWPSMSGGVSPIALSRAACSSVTCGALSILGPFVSGAFVASSLAKRACKLEAARFWGTTGLIRKAIERVLSINRGGMMRIYEDVAKVVVLLATL